MVLLCVVFVLCCCVLCLFFIIRCYVCLFVCLFVCCVSYFCVCICCIVTVYFVPVVFVCWCFCCVSYIFGGVLFCLYDFNEFMVPMHPKVKILNWRSSLFRKSVTNGCITALKGHCHTSAAESILFSSKKSPSHI